MRNLNHIFIIFSMVFAVGCSSEDDNSNSNENEITQKLIGEWGQYYGSEGQVFRKKLNFRSDSIVEYYTYPNGEPTIGDTGEWSLDGDILTMEFPQGFLVVFVQKVVFTNNDNTVQFLEVEGSEYEPFGDIYYRENSIPNNPVENSFNLEISGRYQTDWCEVTSNVSNITFEFLEDTVIESSMSTQGNNHQTTSLNRDLSGDIIGIRLRLTEYDPNNLDASMGDGFDNLHLKVTNNLTDNVVNDTNLTAYLVSCTDIVYALEIFFNTDTGEISVNGFYDTND